MPDGTKPLPEPMLTNHQWSLLAFTWWQFSQQMLRISILDMSLKILVQYYCHISQGWMTSQQDWERHYNNYHSVTCYHGYCKKDVTPFLTHWSYFFLALTHRYEVVWTQSDQDFGYYFTDNILKLIFLLENHCILIPISLKFVPKFPINTNRSLVEIITWRWTATIAKINMIVKDHTNKTQWFVWFWSDFYV